MDAIHLSPTPLLLLLLSVVSSRQGHEMDSRQGGKTPLSQSPSQEEAQAEFLEQT